jgi:hypothetical protein
MQLSKERVEALLEASKASKRRLENFKTEINRIFFESQISDLKLLHKRKKNPLFAFEALLLFQNHKRPIPSWVLGYLTNAAEFLFNLDESDTSGERASEFIMDALNMKRIKGGRSIFADYWAERETLSIYYKVKEFRELIKQKELSRKKGQSIYDIVGETLNMSPSKVKKVYYAERKKRKEEKNSPHGKPHLY